MVGLTLVLCWLALAAIFVAFGRLVGSELFMAVGAIMLVLTAGIAGFIY
jgi:hypothetical protein